MNHSKYRVWLISIVLAAAALLGIIWYVSGREEEKTITEGTLVWQEMSGAGQEDLPGYVPEPEERTGP